MNATEKIEALQRCEALAKADPAALEQLAEAAQAEFFQTGDVVFAEGDVSSHVYVVASGSLRIRLAEEAKLVSIAEPGALVGEYAMFAKGVRTARVVAVEPTVLLSLDEQPFREFLLRAPAAMMELLQTAVRRLHRAERPRG